MILKELFGTKNKTVLYSSESKNFEFALPVLISLEKYMLELVYSIRCRIILYADGKIIDKRPTDQDGK